ncbi:sodium channel and clathrin linker 1-like isoform X2 [Tenebrio molitor]|uniref:sodium channel and clathrin linker 1-like isoform X2 n=1 Tax=Tenebrio molitor TaxID=7067 RepID=UPI0036247353
MKRLLGMSPADHDTIRRALSENTHLSAELNRILSDRGRVSVEHKYKDTDFIDNLKLQLKIVVDEKNQAIKLWQNATAMVEQLEGELRVYHENTEGLIPKSQLIQLKQSYEDKLNELQETVTRTKTKLEETINLKSKELQIKDKEITGTLQSQDNTFKIIKNLESEVLNLQQRLNDANGDKDQLEKSVRIKNEEMEALKNRVKECKAKVEEALHVVEAALNEKDAALLREAEAKEETARLSQTLSEFIDETDTKIKTIRTEHETQVEHLKQAFQTSQEMIKLKESEIENYARKCAFLETETEKLRKCGAYADDTGVSKILLLEKSFEGTFQKLLLSEKHNIQLKSEVDSIKSDIDNMSHYYERDINAREAEKSALKGEIKKLKMELDENLLKVSQSTETIDNLKEKMSAMELSFKEQIKETKSSFQQTCVEREVVESFHNQLVEELQEQLVSQTEINKKWRAETKNITEQLERIITELKTANNKMKQENRALNERLKEANLKMFEYRKFLEMISQDVTKITTITLPESTGECAS